MARCSRKGMVIGFDGWSRWELGCYDHGMPSRRYDTGSYFPLTSTLPSCPRQRRWASHLPEPSLPATTISFMSSQIHTATWTLDPIFYLWLVGLIREEYLTSKFRVTTKPIYCFHHPDIDKTISWNYQSKSIGKKKPLTPNCPSDAKEQEIAANEKLIQRYLASLAI